MPHFGMQAHPGSITRRDTLRLGGLTALGLGLGDWFNLRARAQSLPVRAKACILIWLDGGPSHLETFDPKPDAPQEVRGPFAAIPTSVPGIHLAEVLPNTAKIMDQIALVRSITSPLGEHGLANHYLLTGYKPTAALQYPSFGSVLAHHQPRGVMPPYIALPDIKQLPAAGPGFLGRAAQPFAINGDPAKADFRVRDLEFSPQVPEDRIRRRQGMLSQLDRFHRAADEAAAPVDSAFEQAFRLVTSPKAKRAFDLSQETPETRARYGSRTIGQSCLLARRLVEAGAAFVTINNTGWDTHADLSLRLKDGYAGAKVGVGLVPSFDMAFAALVGDMKDRGLLNQTLVIAMGEFGRTPKLNTSRGRDHWPRVFSAAFAGGGIGGGRVIGASDRVGESPAARPVTPSDLAATFYTLLGVDPRHELTTPDGRPIRINQDGTLVRELLA